MKYTELNYKKNNNSEVITQISIIYHRCMMSI